MKIDLITGFLGSGKTTFIHSYAKFLMRQGLHICILENDYGAINVDMMFLQDLICEQCDLEMVVGGDGYEAHRRRLKTKLISMAMMGFDRVIMEPSGLYDVDELFDVLREEPLDKWYEVGSIIAVVDPTASRDLSEESAYLVASQIACAGTVVISKESLVTEDDILKTCAYCNQVMEMIHCTPHRKEDFVTSDWKDLDDRTFKRIMQSGYRREEHVKLPVDRDNDYQSLFYFYLNMPKDQLLKGVREILERRECGTVIRVKGYMKLDENRYIMINATKEQFCTEYTFSGQEALVVIGEHLNREAIDPYFLKFARYSGLL